ncbi:unnamed protein product, partial [Porites evermanni]
MFQAIRTSPAELATLVFVVICHCKSVSSDDGDGNGNATKAIGLVSKTTILHVHHAFLYISVPSLDDYDRKHTSDYEISSLFLNLNMVLRNSTLGGHLQRLTYFDDLDMEDNRRLSFFHVVPNSTFRMKFWPQWISLIQASYHGDLKVRILDLLSHLLKRVSFEYITFFMNSHQILYLHGQFQDHA